MPIEEWRENNQDLLELLPVEAHPPKSGMKVGQHSYTMAMLFGPNDKQVTVEVHHRAKAFRVAKPRVDGQASFSWGGMEREQILCAWNLLKEAAIKAGA